jgi:hypothetical protein
VPRLTYEDVADAVQAVLVAETKPLVDAGAAVLDADDHGWSLRPRSPDACAVTVHVQSETEVSLFPTAPGTDRSPTLDLYDKDSAALVEAVRLYVRAFLAGSVELTLRNGSSNGRVRVSLPDARTRSHFYNVSGLLVGRGSGWETFRPAPYG